MKPFFLLPNKFKRLGLFLFPIGLTIWMTIQLGWFGAEYKHDIKVLLLSVSFFSFIFGLYFTIFSRERFEDEYIKSVRLKSFQISSVIQMLYFLISFSIMFFSGMEPNGNGGLSVFFLSAIVLFWITYLATFNVSLISDKMKADE